MITEKKWKWFLVGLLLFVGIMLIIAVNVAQAQPPDPIELQPTFILMDGEDKTGIVYGLDYGWVIMTKNVLNGAIEETIYTCGCEECTVEEIFTYETPIPPTDTPFTDPTPVPPDPTPIPPEPTPEQIACNRGRGNGAENCDPGNSGGKPGNAGEDNE